MTRHWSVAGLIVLIIAVYWNALYGEFQFDDGTFLFRGVLRTDPMDVLSKGVVKVLTSGARPVTDLTFVLNHSVGGSSVTGYHAVNIVIHMLAVIAVWFIVRRTLHITSLKHVFTEGREWIALIVAGIFAVHPLQTESVSYIVQRAESLASLFYVISLYCMVRYVRADGTPALGFWVGGMACFLLGWMSKEIIVTMPVIFILYTLYFMDKEKVKKAVVGISPMLVLGAILGIKEVIGFKGSTHVGFDIAGLGQPEYFYTEMRVLLTYLRLIFLPVNQNLDYDYPVYRSFLNIQVISSTLLWLLVVGSSIYTLRVKGRWKWHVRVMGFGMLWFLVILLPTSSLVPLRDVIYEHRVYLAMLGVIVMALAVLDVGRSYAEERYGFTVKKPVLLFMAVAVVLTLSVATYQRNKVWQTKMSLWQDVVKKSPNKSRVHNNLGTIYYEKGRYEEAATEYLKAINLNPMHASSYNNLGLIYQKQGDYSNAEKYYRLAMQMLKNYADPHINLGSVYLRQSKYKQAIEMFQLALKMKPYDAGIYNNLGSAFALSGKLDKAIIFFKKAVEMSPGYFDAYNNLGKSYGQAGMLNEAAMSFKRALALDPYSADARFNLGVTYLRSNNKEAALREYEYLVRLDIRAAGILKDQIDQVASELKHGPRRN